ncbi:kinesin light chain [Paragonimus westermani]|uniref:Kinesin light chain n=1 Tax=Paragonimus westermani TaxID=34504 RepID=A0A5J4NS45_9TREM|nr:kinesin light chain [Paragonimus westermani]
MGMPSHVKQNLKSAQLTLESLKHDHEQALLALNTFCSMQNGESLKDGFNPQAEKIFNQEKVPLIKSALNRIQSGLDESEAIFTFAKYVECVEAENMKLNLHNQRLCEEATWLRVELKHTQSKLKTNNLALIEVIKEKSETFPGSFVSAFPTNFFFFVKVFLDSCHESQTSAQPRMSASVIGLTTFPRHIASSPAAYKGGTHSSRVAVVQSMTGSHRLESSACTNTSLTDGDLATLSTTQSCHPGMIGKADRKFSACSLSSSSMVPPRVRTLHRIVVQYTNQGKHEVAASLCLQAITNLERAGGRDQTEVAVLLNMLALVYRDQGKYEEASELLQNVVDIRERLLGSNHPLVAAALNNLAVLYAKAARFSDAEPLCRRALSIREKILGPNHLDVAKQLNNLALLCQSQGKFDEVEMSFRKALDIYLKQYKPSSPIVLRAKNNLASALLKRGNAGDAEILLKGVLSPDQSTQRSGYHAWNKAGVLSTAEVDSAVFSFSSTSSSYNHPAGSCSSTNGVVDIPPGHSGPGASNRTIPIWLLVEQAGREGRGQLARLSKFDVSAWAAEAHIDLKPAVNIVSINSHSPAVLIVSQHIPNYI